MAQLTLYLDDETEARLKETANSAGMSLSRWVANLIREKIASQWPVSVIELAGAWADLPTAEELRAEMESGKVEPARSIAVLPFADMSPERDQGYFCEGIAEEILNALAKIQSLRVAARSSAFQFKDRSVDLREVGRRLDVNTLLEGGVRKAGDRVRITVQLINVADGYQLWTDRFDRQIQDIFAIQDEISQNVVQALQVTLSPKEERAMERQVADIKAYDYYLRGRQFLDQTSRRGFEFARQMFQRAVEIDPGFGQAHAGIAECHSWLFSWFGRGEGDLAEADRASRKAVELAPDLAEAHASRGFALSLGERSEEAAGEFETAIELDPKLFEAYYFYGRDLFSRGEFERAAELLEKASEVRPEDYQAPLLLPQVYRSLGRSEDEKEAWRRGLERVERHLDLNPDDARALCLGSTALLGQGERERAMDWVERALALRPDDPTTLYNCACFYSLAGEVERSLDCLERAVGTGFGLRDWIEHDSDLDPLRDHPRYQQLLTRMP